MDSLIKRENNICLCMYNIVFFFCADDIKIKRFFLDRRWSYELFLLLVKIDRDLYTRGWIIQLN